MPGNQAQAFEPMLRDEDDGDRRAPANKITVSPTTSPRPTTKPPTLAPLTEELDSLPPPAVSIKDGNHEAKPQAEVEQRKQPQHVNSDLSRGMNHGVYWRTRFTMISATVIGTTTCLGHHFFYQSLVGQPAVDRDQENYIRAGSFLAWLAQLFLTTSVWTVYTQWLWFSLAKNNPAEEAKPKTLADPEDINSEKTDGPKSSGYTPQYSGPNKTTLKILDAATSVQSSLISLLHFWLFKNLKIAYVLAIIAWLLQIPALVTPATLVVVPSLNITGVIPVPVLDITNVKLNTSFAYDSPMEANGPKNALDLAFVGARSIVLTIASAAASSGKIQDITPPLNGSSYQEFSMVFPAPYTRCQDANDTEIQIINATVNEVMSIPLGTYRQSINAFSAFIPVFNSTIDDAEYNTTTVNVDGTTATALWDADLQRPLNTSTNEIWMRFYRYKKDVTGQYIRGPDNQKIPPDLHFTVCKLYDARYDATFSWNNGFQSVVNSSVSDLKLMPHPDDSKGRPSDLVAHAYTAVFLALANEVVGTMAFYYDTETNVTEDYAERPPRFSSFQTRIHENSLTGSDDLDYYFAVNKQLFTNNLPEPLSAQRLQDKAVAKNKTLDALIEDLSFNITISLLHDPLLARQQNSTAKFASDGNQYTYVFRNLVIPYTLAVVATLVTNAMGLWAYWRNNASFDLSFSTLVSVTRSRKLDNLFPPCCHGVQPLPEESLEAELEVRESWMGTRPGRNIVLVGDSRPVCTACKPQEPPYGKERRLSSYIKPFRRNSVLATSPPLTSCTPAPSPDIQSHVTPQKSPG